MDVIKSRANGKLQINGCRQRFLTKFLKVRLVEVKKTVEERLEKLEAEAIEVEVSLKGRLRFASLLSLALKARCPRRHFPKRVVTLTCMPKQRSLRETGESEAPEAEDRKQSVIRGFRHVGCMLNTRECHNPHWAHTGASGCCCPQLQCHGEIKESARLAFCLTCTWCRSRTAKLEAKLTSAKAPVRHFPPAFSGSRFPDQPYVERL